MPESYGYSAKHQEKLYDKRYGDTTHHRNNGGGSSIGGLGKHFQQQDLLNGKVRIFAGDKKNIHPDIRRAQQRNKENSSFIVDNVYN
tara:strand:- start:883 stop:1143 length:261 start_codon:yes stop_codon:yes gene_type:complete